MKVKPNTKRAANRAAEAEPQGQAAPDFAQWFKGPPMRRRPWFKAHTRAVLAQHIAPDGIAQLERRVKAWLDFPPADIPTLIQAEEQLQRLQFAVGELSAALRAAPWVAQELGHLARARKEPVSVLDLQAQLDALRSVASVAAQDLAKARAAERKPRRGDRAHRLTREVVRAVLDELTTAGVRLTQTPTGAAAQCVQAVLDAAFPGTSEGAGLAHVRAMIGKPRAKRHSA